MVSLSSTASFLVLHTFLFLRFVTRRAHSFCRHPLLVKLPKSRITVHLHSFVPLFSHLWNQLTHSNQSHSSPRSSRQFLKILNHLPSKMMIFLILLSHPFPTQVSSFSFLRVCSCIHLVHSLHAPCPTPHSYPHPLLVRLRLFYASGLLLAFLTSLSAVPLCSVAS